MMSLVHDINLIGAGTLSFLRTGGLGLAGLQQSAGQKRFLVSSSAVRPHSA